MGTVCGGEKSKKPTTNTQTHPSYPQSKYSIAMTNDTLIAGTDIQAVVVTEGLVYNQLVKQGVQRQRGEAPDGDCIFLYSPEEKQLAQKFSQIGLIGIASDQSDILDDAKTAKVLFNFKTLWVFRDSKFDHSMIQNFLKKLDQVQVKLKQINLYTKPLSQLVQKYNLLEKQNTILNALFPLQLYSSGDVLSDQTRNNQKDEGFQLFLHGVLHVSKVAEANINLYSECLSIRNILFLYDCPDLKLMKQLENQGLYKLDILSLRNQDGTMDINILIKKFIPYLQKMKAMNSNLLIVHEQGNKQIVFDALSEYLARDQLVHRIDIDKYIELRKGGSIQAATKVQSQLNGQPQQQQQPIFDIGKSRCEEITHLYKSLTEKTKSPMAASSAHKTVLKLLENIINAPTEEKFRSIQSTNKTIQLNVIQYEEGRELLKLCGFLPIESAFKNTDEVGMLRLCRGDLELGFKNASS